jgi:HK97 family phage major capsid protein
MKFKTIAEAFNYYRNHSVVDIEKRAQEIGQLIDKDPNADIESLNIELDGLKEAKKNIEERSAGNPGAAGSGFNPITGMSFNQNQNRVPEGDQLFASAEYRSAFYKTLLNQKLNEVETAIMKQAGLEKRADAFNTLSNSAAVLPTQTLNEVISKARKIGGLISVCRQFNVPANLAVPIGTPSTKAAWHVEGAPVTTENNTPVNVTFGAFELIKIFSMSAAAQKMTISAFESYLIDELNKCIMEAIADSLVNGTGTTQGTGVLTGVTWDTSNSFTYSKTSGPAYKDFTKMLAMLKRGYSAGAKWAMSNATLYNNVYGVVDGNNRPIFITDPKTEDIGYILGKPVVVDDNIVDDTITLGNFDYMGFNIPLGVLIETSRDSSFKSGLIDYRALAIADTKPLVTEAFIKTTRSAT